MTRPSEEFWRRIVAAAASVDSRSYYDVLGVARDASGDAIHDAYYALVRRLHPDRYARERNAAHKAALVKLYARVGEAYRTLTDPKLRSRYDAGLDQGQMRLAPDAKPLGRPLVDARDPRTPQGRQLYERGKALLDGGDRKAARAQLELAAQFEPDSKVIAAALAEAKGELSQVAPAPAPGPAAKRTHPRHPVQQPVTIRCRTWDQVETVYTKNISAGGMFLKSSRPVDIGTPMELQLKLPDDRVLALPAKVVHVVQPGDPQGRTPGVGVAFDELEAATREALAAMLPRRNRPTSTAPPPNHPEAARILRELEVLARQYQQARPSEILAVDPAAGQSLRAAYVALARRYHPDRYGRYGSAAVVAAAEEVAFLVRRAYDKLRGASGGSP